MPQKNEKVIHSFNLTTWNQNDFLLKLDLAKAFDRLEWDFIATVSWLFHQPHQNLYIHSHILGPCQWTAMPTFRAQRGIHQGCPLSPFCYRN